MSNRLIAFSLSKPLLVYCLILVITLISGVMIVNIKVDTDPENMLSRDEPARVFHNQVKQDFLLEDLIVVGVKVSQKKNIFNQQSLADLKSLTDFVQTIEGVKIKDVNSLSAIDNISQEEPGTIRFEWMMKQAPIDELVAQEIEVNAMRLPFVVNSLVSQDKKAATIYVPILDKNESYRISNEISQFAKSLSSTNTYYLTGLPVAEDTFGVEMFIQMGISAPLAAAVIYFLMLYFFRSAVLVSAPMIVAMSTVIIVMGVMIGLGYTVHIMSSMIPIFLMPIAVVDSVHLMSEFADRYKPGENAKAVIKKVTEHLFQPMLFTSITSAVGFFSLALTPIPPVQIFGIFVGTGIFIAFISTILFIPAYISRMSDKQLSNMQRKLHQSQNAKNRLAGILSTLGKGSIIRNKLIILVTLIIIGVSIIGIYKIQINDNPVRWFKHDHPIRVADKVLNQHFAGTYDAHLVFRFKDEVETINRWKQKVTQQVHNENINSTIKEKLLNRLTIISNHESLQSFNLLLDDISYDATDTEVVFLDKLIKHTDETIQSLSVFVQPENLIYIESLQNYLSKTGLVGKSNSVVDLIKTVNRDLLSSEEKDYKIPASYAAVSQALLQFQSSHRPQDLWHFITPDFTQSLVWLQMTSGDNKDMSAVVNLVDTYIKENPLPSNIEVKWAGKAYINLIWQEKMVAGMFDSLTSAFFIVFAMMVFLFRSVFWGLLAMLPLSITIVLMYGVIGWSGKYYDMPIAVLSALTLGLSVDFAIHFIERTRAYIKQNNSWEKTAKMIFQEPARAISRNALVIAFGFTPLLLAPLVPYITVGAFLATIMIISALVTLLVLPASMELFKKYVFK
ncbi:efflux RND transporter permease subunit [Aliikangiella sp. IMCC44359]|uniref:efflux RND transporter permease subunit n=1 Tax=Aliikangiella sp. IMCC44359 TaxID=3459125 RepID=UPI00403B34AF